MMPLIENDDDKNEKDLDRMYKELIEKSVEATYMSFRTDVTDRFFEDNNENMLERKNIYFPPKENVNKSDMHDVRIITFNMLSQDAATPEYFPYVKDHHLRFSYRVSRMKKLLTSWMKANFIICLQEFNKGWAQSLKGFFENNQYKIFYEMYAKDKMGVAIAYPTNHFNLLSVDVATLGTDIGTVCRLFKYNNHQQIEPIKLSVVTRELELGEETRNVLLSVILRPKYYGKEIGKNLIISTYHMPCKFTQKYYMIAQIVALKTSLDRLLSSTKMTYPGPTSIIVTGDFNISPNNQEYKLLTGILYTEEELMNPLYEAIATMKSVYESIGMRIDYGVNIRSAHNSLHNKEPTYTNVSVKFGATFVGCLDYILIDKLTDIRSCTVGLTTQDPVKDPYPNGICPSDHLPLSASLRI